MLQVTYNSKDITSDLKDFIKRLDYVDNVSGQADDLALTVEDTSGLWKGDWRPEKGDRLEILIDGKLPTGRFYMDEFTGSGPPSVFTLKASSVPEKARERHSRGWEQITLSKLANDVAVGLGFRLIFECDFDPVYDRVDQIDQTNLGFLAGLCSREAIAVKVSNGQLVLIDEQKYDSGPTVRTIDKDADSLEKYELKNKSFGCFRACRVQYHNPITNEAIDYTSAPPAMAESGYPVLQINHRVESINDAERLARKTLRGANKNEVSGFLILPGDAELAAGVNVNLQNFGLFDGKYAITKCIHRVIGRHITEVRIRKALEGY